MTSSISANLVQLAPDQAKIFISRSDGDQTKLNKFITESSNVIQLVDVKESLAFSKAPKLSSILGSYIILKDVRPELFLRRDFISKFVEKGLINLSQAHGGHQYGICSSNNAICIRLDGAQYRRFGIIAERLMSASDSSTRYYEIKVDLKDARIQKSNKFQDRLVEKFRRLPPLRELYFSFRPRGTNSQSSDENNNSLEFFEFVIDEYARDGFKPVPLSSCTKVNRKIEKTWARRSQICPSLELTRESDILTAVDWLGFQLLGLDCDREEIRNLLQPDYYETVSRLDVECSQSNNYYDREQSREVLASLLANEVVDESIRLRAIFLYNQNSNLIFLKEKSKSELIVVRFEGASIRQIRKFGQKKKRKQQPRVREGAGHK